MTAFIVTPRLGTPSGTNLGLESVRIAVETRTDGSQSQLLVFQIVGATDTVASVTELAICKAVAIPTITI